LPTDNYVSTCKDKTIYLHILNWPQGSDFQLPPLPARVLSARLLGTGKADVRQTASGIVINIEQKDRKEPDTIVAIDLDIKAGDIKQVAAAPK